MAKRSRSNSDVTEPDSKRRRKGPLSLASLPDEVLLKVLSELPISSLSLCQRLSRHFNKLAIDSQIWKQKYYDRWVLPRALRIPGLRDPSTDSKSFIFSSKLSKWLGDDHLVKRGKETNWKRQYRLRHNWSKGTCQVNEVEVAQPPAPPLLAKLYRGIIFTADASNGLRAWSARNRGTLLASISLRSSESTRRKLPSTLAVGKDILHFQKSISIVIGFHDGTFDVHSLLPDDNIFKLRYSHSRASDTNVGTNIGLVTSVAFAESYVATLTSNQSLSLYRFDDIRDATSTDVQLNRPKLLSVLKANNIGSIVSLSLRTSSQGVIASIAYMTTSVSHTNLLAIQELRLDPSGHSLGSRLASTDLDNSHIPEIRGSFVHSVKKLVDNAHLYSTGVRAISYSHPYLLVTSLDNTMTVNLVDSTPHALTIRSGHRLWGHTAGISSAQVSDRGKAVSVANFGNEMRIWELEEMMLSPWPGRVFSPEVSTQVHPVGVAVDERERIAGLSQAIAQRGNGLGLALEETRWVGFDDEQVVVLKERKVGTQMLSCYDFR